MVLFLFCLLRSFSREMRVSSCLFASGVCLASLTLACVLAVPVPPPTVSRCFVFLAEHVPFVSFSTLFGVRTNYMICV